MAATRAGRRQRCTRGGWPTARTPEELRQQFRDNLESLGAERLDLVVEVDVPVALQPGPTMAGQDAVSAGIWGLVTVSVRMNRFLWIEDLIALIGEGVAPPPDPAGPVESMCRRVGSVLAASDAFDWYKVVVKNIASGYAAFASSEWPEPAETAAIH